MKPNVLIMHTDQQRFDSLGFCGLSRDWPDQSVVKKGSFIYGFR